MKASLEPVFGILRSFCRLREYIAPEFKRKWGKRVRKKRRMLILSAVLIQAVFAGGCGLLPAEETGGNIMLVKSEAAPDYEMIMVSRGDVVLDQTLYCTYAQLKEEHLSFGANARTVQHVYVGMGDNVKQGDMLAKLYTDDLDGQLENLTERMEKNSILLRQLKELKDYDLSAAEQSYRRGNLTKAQYEERVEQIERSTRSQIQSYEDSLYIDGLYAEQLEEQLAGCYIYAGMDGVVSSVRSRLEGSRSTAGVEVITVVDSSQCAFRCDRTEYADYFADGQEVVLKGSSELEYVAEVLSAEEAPDNKFIYFTMKELDLALAVGVRASVTIELDARRDVLMLPNAAIYHADDKKYVYCQDENGLKMMKFVSVGLKGSQYTEIIEGLQEGDIVIKR